MNGRTRKESTGKAVREKGREETPEQHEAGECPRKEKDCTHCDILRCPEEI